MSKIDAYNESVRQVKVMEQFIAEMSKQCCDKFGCWIKVTDSYMGFYGNSSCYPWPKLVVTMTEADLGQHLRASFNRSLDRLKGQAESARLAAKEEAKAVLQETGKETVHD